MPYTLLQLRLLVEQAISGPMPARLDPTQVINEAGQYFYTMTSWYFADVPPAPVYTVASQDWVDLPSDFSAIKAISVPKQSYTDAELSTLSQIQLLRSSPIVDPGKYYVAVEWKDGNPRLAIWPTPGTTSTTPAFYVVYSAGWVPLVEPTDVANVPPQADPLLAEVVRIFARGLADDEGGKASVGQRLKLLKDSPLFTNIATQGAQDNLGQMRGGILSGGTSRVYRPHRRIGNAG
jgi:hypothetical protein